jgi:hypothetical protein
MSVAINNVVSYETCHASARCHNTYPVDTNMKQIDMKSDAVNELCRVVAKFGYHRITVLRLLHRHRDLRDGQILLERKVQEGYVVEPTPAHEIDLGLVCGQVFSVYNGTLQPTQFIGGRPDADLHEALDELYESWQAMSGDDDFISEVIKVILRNKLDRVLGIEVRLDQRPRMIEFSNDYRSCLFDEASVEIDGECDFQSTAWRVTESGSIDDAADVRCVIIGRKKHAEVPAPEPKPSA